MNRLLCSSPDQAVIDYLCHQFGECPLIPYREESSSPTVYFNNSASTCAAEGTACHYVGEKELTEEIRQPPTSKSIGLGPQH